MRRKEREVNDIAEIFSILKRCDTIRIGIQNDKYPYIVPVSFGAELIDKTPIIYFHCAQQGMKIDLLKANPNVCVEGDIFIKIEKIKHGITSRFESVIGFGKCQFISNFDEIVHGLKILTEHYGYFNYPLDQCKGIQHVHVGKITIEEITGKRNMPE